MRARRVLAVVGVLLPAFVLTILSCRAGGRVYGEFEDAALCRAAPSGTTPTDAAGAEARSEKEVWEGCSGATIQAKTMGGPVPARLVLLKGKVVAEADGFGQFLVDLPPGRHSLVGRCEGYLDSVVEVELKGGEVIYRNFYLTR